MDQIWTPGEAGCPHPAGGVSRRTNVLVNMKLAYDILYLPIHLIQSALGQKVGAKPMGWCYRESCQGRAAMSGREVAGLAGVMGLPQKKDQS
jgi:hypothetical protein